MIHDFNIELELFGISVYVRIVLNSPKKQGKLSIFPRLQYLRRSICGQAWLRLILSLFGLSRALVTFLAWKMALKIISLPKNIKKAFTSDKQGSLYISRFFRSVFEANLTRKLIGVNLAAAVIVTSVMQVPIAALEKPELLLENQAEEVAILPEPEEVVRTETTYRWPVGGYISQGYRWYHPGIDLAGNDNQIIYPITSGKVVAIEYSRWGFGNSVIVDHEDGLVSRYAHLSYIKIEDGQEIDKNTALGYVGSTGFSTGPHLHLEIIEKGRNINPLSVLPEKR